MMGSEQDADSEQATEYPLASAHARARTRGSLTRAGAGLAATAAWYLGLPHIGLRLAGWEFHLLIYGAALGLGVLVAGTIRGVVASAGWTRRTGWLLFGVAALTAIVTTAASLPVVSDLAKIGVGVVGGMALGAAIERPGWLAPVALAVSMADLWSVFARHGVTHIIITRAPAAVPRLTIDVPVPGLAWGHGLLIGIVDVLFLAVYITAACRLALSVRAVTIIGACSLMLSIVLSVELLDARPVPVLPVLSLLVVLVTARPVVRDLRAMWRERVA